MSAANERVRECWERACALAGLKGAGRGSIGAQVDAALEVLTGAELVAARALFGEAWRLVAQHGDAEGAAEHLRLGAAICEQRGRVLGALKAAQAVEDAFWPVDLDGCGRSDRSANAVDAGVRCAQLRDAVQAMVDNGFGPEESKIADPAALDSPSWIVRRDDRADGGAR